MSKIVTILTLLLLALPLPAMDVEGYWRELQGLSTDSLTRLASYHIDQRQRADSGLVCVNMIISRYSPDMPIEDKEKVVEAMSTKWFVYSLLYFNHAKGFQCLHDAEKICRENGLVLGPLLFNFACTYQTIAEQTGDREMYQKAYDYLTEAMEAFEQRRFNGIHVTFSNLVSVATELGRLDDIEPISRRYAADKEQNYTKAFNMVLYRGMTQMSRGRYEDAAATFAHLQDSILPYPQGVRFQLLSLESQAKAWMGAGKPERGIALLQQAVDLAREWGQRDALVGFYRLLAEMHAKNGDKDKSDECRNKFYTLRDSILNFQQINSIKDTGFLSQMEQKDAQLEQSAQKRRYMTWGLWAAAVALVVVVGFLVMLRRNYRRISEANESLYRQIMQNIDSESREPERARSRKPMAEGSSVASAPSPGTGMSSDEDRELMATIRQALVKEGAVYQPDFCAQRLSDITSVPYAYLSQAINKVTGQNFNTLVKQYRVREACRLLGDPTRSAAMTIEGVGQTVGYATRQTFVKAFKEITGLTPSDFRKAAQK